MKRVFGWATLVLAVAGCHSWSLGPYVSPQVTGRVVAADTGQPVAGVIIIRGRPEPAPRQPPKGGELLIQKGPPQSGPDGEFHLASERVLTLVRWGGWNTVRLAFEHPDFRRFQTNYPPTHANLTNAPDGTPLLNTGVIPLERKKKGAPEGPARASGT